MQSGQAADTLEEYILVWQATSPESAFIFDRTYSFVLAEPLRRLHQITYFPPHCRLVLNTFIPHICPGRQDVRKTILHLPESFSTSLVLATAHVSSTASGENFFCRHGAISVGEEPEFERGRLLSLRRYYPTGKASGAVGGCYT